MIISRKLRILGCTIKFDIYIDGQKVDRIGIYQKKEIKLTNGYHKVSLGFRNKIRSNELNIYINEDENIKLVCGIWIFRDIFVLLLLFSFYMSILNRHDIKQLSIYMMISSLITLIAALAMEYKKIIVLKKL